MYYMHYYVDPKELPLNLIVSDYTLMRRDIVFFEQDDMCLLTKYCHENGLFLMGIVSFVLKKPYLFTHILTKDSYSEHETNDINAHIKRVNAYLENITDPNIYFECCLRRYTNEHEYENIDIKELPLKKIVSKYHMKRKNMTLFNSANIHSLIDYCHRNELYILAMEKFTIEENYTYLGEIYDGSHLIDKKIDIGDHIQLIKKYLEHAMTPKSYFSCLLGKYAYRDE